MTITKTELKRNALELPIEDRLELAEAIWESLEDEAPELPGWQREILDERIAADDEAPEEGSTWHEVKQRILQAL